MSTDHHEHFIIPLKYYIGTFITLAIMTVITVAISRIDLGVLNTPVALGIACFKASLVLLFFMGLRWDKGISTVLVIGSIGIIIVFFLFTFSDIAFRDTFFKAESEIFGIKSPVKIVTPHHGINSHETPAHH